MKILLDTQIFLWYITKDQRLPVAMLQSIRHTENEVYLSVVSLWEVIVKYQIGKLPLPQPPEFYLPEQRQRHQIQNLDLDEASILQLIKLPDVHRDPFDRMLVCQAIQHGMVLATVDAQVLKYSVRLLPISRP
jgi:PIN domain nuclease of toxin-antitoxin system